MSVVLAVVGEFGGAGSAARFHRIDRDGFDTTMAGLGASVRLPAPNRSGRDLAEPPDATLPLRSLDDFRPDALVAAIPGLALLRQARTMTPESMRQGAGAPALPPSTGAWQSTVDRLLDTQVRALLHHPRLQALEATWRGLHALVAGVAGVPDVAVHVLDLPRAALDDGARLERLLHGLPDGIRALVTDLEIGPEPEDVARLESLGAVAARVGAPLVAGATPALLGCPDASALGTDAVPLGSDALRRLRDSPVASHVALAVPRLLLRPFHDPTTVTGFAFDEASAPDAPPLWGGSPFVVAQALVRGGASTGGDTWLVEWPGSPRVEVGLSDAAAARIVAAGCIALASATGGAALRVAGMRTLAGTPLRIA